MPAQEFQACLQLRCSLRSPFLPSFGLIVCFQTLMALGHGVSQKIYLMVSSTKYYSFAHKGQCFHNWWEYPCPPEQDYANFEIIHEHRAMGEEGDANAPMEAWLSRAAGGGERMMIYSIHFFCLSPWDSSMEPLFGGIHSFSWLFLSNCW